MFSFLTSGIKISSKKLIAVIMLFSPSLSWFYVITLEFFSFQESSINLGFDKSWIAIGHALFYLSILGCSILGSIIAERYNRKKFLIFWICFGIASSLSFLLMQTLFFFLFLTILAGASFGIGFPSCLAFLTESTKIEERARVSGVAIFLTFIFIVLVIGTSSVMQIGFLGTIIFTLILRASSFISVLIDPLERKPNKNSTWSFVFNNKSFGLYLVSWLLFILADGISLFVQSWVPEELISPTYEGLRVIASYLALSFSSIISGFLSDRFGRKIIIIFGMSILGISFQFLNVISNSTIFLITEIIYGMAWGIIFVNYYVTVIGDFSSGGSKEKFFTVGGIVPFVLYMTTNLLSDFFVFPLSRVLVSSILSIILFISVITIIFSEETLPKKFVQKREHDEHLEQLKKLIEEDKK